MSTHFRLRWSKRGGHVHVRMFSAPSPYVTHGKCGDLVFQEDEWVSFQLCLRNNADDTVDIVHEDEPLV